MKTFDLKATLRSATGKKDAKNLRRNGQVPCVLYGGKENVHFAAQARDFKDLVYTHHTFIVDIDVEGKKHLAVMKELQFHPVSDDINHIDFIEVSRDKAIIVELPVEITGNSIGIRAGGKLRQRKRYVKVKGLMDKLPDVLTLDISDLDIGGSILAGDVKIPEVEILEAPRSLIVGVISARAAAKGMGEAETASPAEAAAAPAAAAPAAEAKKEK
ncbi:MAG TPA: 50S ribosomal protein L25 [Bacteroidales bacterium]|nr:50S ribosomal protein L25 [Bacteroidales bacterium]